MDPQSSCRSLGALAVQLYQQLIRTAEKRLKPMIGMAWAWGTRWALPGYRSGEGVLCSAVGTLLQRPYP